LSSKDEAGSSSADPNTSEKGVPMGGKRCSPKTLTANLKKLGIDPEAVGKCVKAAITKGHIIFNGEPRDHERLIIEEDYDDHHYKVYLKDVLYQPDLPSDWMEPADDATVVCTCCELTDDEIPQLSYVTRLCYGNPNVTMGKYHNHCTECKGLGKCLGDYRESHCHKCNKHWFEGNCGSRCYNCKKLGLDSDSSNSESNSDSDF